MAGDEVGGGLGAGQWTAAVGVAAADEDDALAAVVAVALAEGAVTGVSSALLPPQCAARTGTIKSDRRRGSFARMQPYRV